VGVQDNPKYEENKAQDRSIRTQVFLEGPGRGMSARTPLRLALYSGDSVHNDGGKYCYSSDLEDSYLDRRPTVQVVWGYSGFEVSSWIKCDDV
jgi:hypothetical protein